MSEKHGLGVWDGPDGYSYIITRLHDDDENRLKRIEALLEELITAVAELQKAE